MNQGFIGSTLITAKVHELQFAKWCFLNSRTCILSAILYSGASRNPIRLGKNQYDQD